MKFYCEKVGGVSGEIGNISTYSLYYMLLDNCIKYSASARNYFGSYQSAAALPGLSWNFEKQMYRTRFIYYCMTSRGDNENCTVLFFCCNCIMMQPDEQPDRHMHLTYPWPPLI
ncbi:hypothetical protein T02_9475 [Trichinella nativa]|uniref:Uncharacterized protein n=1 Tax=Trichinella nativa TaxID=6335 RepID=A0A0V1L858_9BILA|nr:hypothetical protein T02_9475 [Trichinella nativa]